MGRRKAKREGEGAGSKRRRAFAPKPKKEEVGDTKGKSNGEVNAEISKPEVAGSSGGGIVHPLLIPHVLENIFQHIMSPKTDDEDNEGSAVSPATVLKNFKNLRLVCKQWKDTATRLYLRNKEPIVLFGVGDVASSKSPDEKMQKFLDVMKNSDLIPFQQYTLQSNFFVKENEQLMADFMRICGPRIVELYLCCDNSRTMKFSRRSFPDLNLTSLKSLTFECEDDTRAVRSPYEIACLIEVLLGAAETLQEFDSILRGKWLQSQALIQRFGDCISKRLPKTVKILSLLMPLNDLHWITLAESEFKLEELDLEINCGASGIAIRKFLENQSATLKLMSISDGFELAGLSPSGSLDFPRFPELLRLDLSEATIQKFSWPDTFPKLSSLLMREWKTESTWVELFSFAKKGLSLKEIHLPEYFPQAPFVKKVAQCFPNISKLQIVPSEGFSETLREVFVYFDNIEELHITFLIDDVDDFGFNADSIFSGVSEQDCRRILKGGNFDNVNIADFQHQPSLLNLTKLKKLDFQPLAGTILTDFAAHFVFLKMPSLNDLRTSQYQISTKYVDLLCEKLTLTLFTNS